MRARRKWLNSSLFQWYHPAPSRALQSGGNFGRQEWYQLTEKLVMRAFGSGSPNVRNFKDTRWAGERRMVVGDYGGIDHALNQRNFEARLRTSEAAVPISLFMRPTGLFYPHGHIRRA